MDIRAIVAEGLGMGIEIQDVAWDDGVDQDVDHGAEWDGEEDALDLDSELEMEIEYGDGGDEDDYEDEDEDEEEDDQEDLEAEDDID